MATTLALLCSGCQLTDMMRFSYENAVSTHSWNGETRQTSIPFKVIDNHIILPVRINGSETMHFVLDSGAAATVVMDSHKTRQLALEPASEITVSGVGTGPDPVAHIVRDTSLELGSILLAGQSVVYLPIESVPFFHSLDDVYFDGVIGAPFFKRFTIEVDHDHKLISFYEPSSAPDFDTASGDWRELPIDIEGGVPYLEARITNSRGEPTAVKLLADTGARGAVSLTPETHEGLPLPTEYFDTISQGLSGDIPGQMTMSESLSLGSYTIGELPVHYAMSGGESENDSNGILGNEILSRFNLVFDYENDRLLLNPNQSFGRHMAADRSGLQIRPHPHGGIVRRIAPDSSAAGSGLKVGDLITSFDGQRLNPESIGELKQLLTSNAPSVQLCWQSAKGTSCGELPLVARL